MGKENKNKQKTLGIISDAAGHIMKQEVKILSITKQEIKITVKDHLVTWKKKAGRTLDSCSCPNHARFCIENPRCSHKLAANCFIVMRRVKF